MEKCKWVLEERLSSESLMLEMGDNMGLMNNWELGPTTILVFSLWKGLEDELPG